MSMTTVIGQLISTSPVHPGKTDPPYNLTFTILYRMGVVYSAVAGSSPPSSMVWIVKVPLSTTTLGKTLKMDHRTTAFLHSVERCIKGLDEILDDIKVPKDTMIVALGYAMDKKHAGLMIESNRYGEWRTVATIHAGEVPNDVQWLGSRLRRLSSEPTIVPKTTVMCVSMPTVCQ
jgi:hypothetical protein